jgi:TfoX/Sxy family transcriptional regulator of competence genes
MPKGQPKEERKWTSVPAERTQTFQEALQSWPAVEIRRMFGCPCAFVNGQMFAVFHQQGLALKLSEEDRGALLEQEGAKPFEPMPGRRMREYVVVPPAVENVQAELQAWLEKAFAYARSLPPKKKGKR